MEAYKFFTTQDIADVLFLEPKAVSRLIRLREISAKKICGQWRISEEDFKEYLNRNKVKAKTGR